MGMYQGTAYKVDLERPIPTTLHGWIVPLAAVAFLAVTISSFWWMYTQYRGGPDVKIAAAAHDVTVNEFVDSVRKVASVKGEMKDLFLPSQTTPTQSATTQPATTPSQTGQPLTINHYSLFGNVPAKVSIELASTVTTKNEPAPARQQDVVVQAPTRPVDNAIPASSGTGPVQGDIVIKTGPPAFQKVPDAASNQQNLCVSVLYMVRNPRTKEAEWFVVKDLRENVDLKRDTASNPDGQFPVVEVLGKKVDLAFSSERYLPNDPPDYVWIKGWNKQVDRRREVFKTYAEQNWFLARNKKGAPAVREATPDIIKKESWQEPTVVTNYRGFEQPVTILTKEKKS